MELIVKNGDQDDANSTFILDFISLLDKLEAFLTTAAENAQRYSDNCDKRCREIGAQ